MGCIRLLLAISVVLTHSYGFVFVGGRFAVQLFYIISGFLMSFVLVEAQYYRSNLAFYLNRFLRLFPIYWVVALLTFSFFSHTNSVYESLDVIGKTVLTISNIMLVGQDWIMFTGFRNGVFQFVTDFSNSEVLVYGGLLVPQAWTLGVEISFYIIAPFVLPKTKRIVYFLFFSIIIRTILIGIGIGEKDPWNYRFFPNELAFFLLGALSHQVWQPIVKNKGWLSKKQPMIISLLILVFCASYFALPRNGLITFTLFTAFILSLPFLFEMQKNHRWDTIIGELSYPVYISHMFVIYSLNALGLGVTSILNASLLILTTIIFSIILNEYVGKKINILRFRIKSNTNFRDAPSKL
jgi:peptidoglycan/LPS O-acetylase OafA/YrhL